MQTVSQKLHLECDNFLLNNYFPPSITGLFLEFYKFERRRLFKFRAKSWPVVSANHFFECIMIDGKCCFETHGSST